MNYDRKVIFELEKKKKTKDKIERIRQSTIFENEMKGRRPNEI